MADKHSFLNKYPILGPRCGAIPLACLSLFFDGKIFFDRYRYF